MAEIYKKRPVQVQKKSGFDKSFQNLFTSKVGTITPVLVDEVIPNTTINLKAAISACLPPLASDTFMRVKLKYASFFVPTRLLVAPGAYERWLTGNDEWQSQGAEASGTTTTVNKIVMPEIVLTNAHVKPGSLADYLGVKVTSATADDTGNFIVSALPFLAYHRIYNDWFRNSLVQKDIYSKAVGSTYNAAGSMTYVPNNSNANNYTLNPNSGSNASYAASTKFMDGVQAYELRQANFDIDMFTSASPEAQNGQAQSVSFDITDPDDSSTVLDSSSFTISALRAANSIQQWLERNNIAGNRMVDYVKAQYGANLNDAVAQRSILLGSGQFDVYSKGIYQNDNNVAATQSSATQSVSTNNPFSSVGARYGSASAEGTDVLINGFTAAEPGYIFVVAWLSPKVTYSTGIDPMFSRYMGATKQSDMANPILQNVGNEPIYCGQIMDKPINRNVVFGYQDRYYAWKDKTDEVHGLLRDGESLQSFALQRTFNGTDAINISTSFLRIPTSYLDQVSAVTGQVSNYGYWCDTYFDYKVSMPLARYSTPSLQDPATEHGETIIVNNRGTQLT